MAKYIKTNLYNIAIAVLIMLNIAQYFTLTRPKNVISFDSILNDYKYCSHKLDSMFQNKIQPLIDSSNIRMFDKRSEVFISAEDMIDSVKVSYPGKDGVQVIKYYPLHKTIID